MAVDVRMNDRELRAVYSLLRSTLMPQSVRDDPECAPLKSFAKKLQRHAASAFCRRCSDPDVHAKGLCNSCYRADLRSEDVPLSA